MSVSSAFRMDGREGLAVLQHRPQHIDAPARERDHRLVMPFAFLALARIERLALRTTQRGEGGLIEDTLEVFVASRGASQEAHFARLPQHGGESCRRSKRIAGVEAFDGACLRDELGGKHGPHAGQATNEGRIRVQRESLLDLSVDCGYALERLESFFGELADEAGAKGLAGQADRLPLRASASRCDELADVFARRVNAEQLAQARFARLPKRRRCAVGAQKQESRLGGQIQRLLKLGKNRSEQVVHARQAAGLFLGEVTPTRDEQPQLQVELGVRLDGPQVASGSHLIGNDSGITRITLGFASDRTLSSAIDGEPRDVNEIEAGLQQHGLRKRGNAAEHVNADANRHGQITKLGHEVHEVLRGVCELAVEQDAACAVDGRDPVQFLSDVDTDESAQATSSLADDRHPFFAVFALQSDGSRSLISGRKGKDGKGEMPPEPSRAASMRTIPSRRRNAIVPRMTAGIEKGRAA
jgi:hypothetical protein